MLRGVILSAIRIRKTTVGKRKEREEKRREEKREAGTL